MAQDEDTDALGSTKMTPERIMKILDSDKRMYYRTKELNDKLYIHFQGFRKIEHLEQFTGLRTLYAECNAFEELQGIEKCTALRSLFFQQNCIRRISGLENTLDLWSINLSENFIEKIENISHLRRLNTLTIAKNRIGWKGLGDYLHLKDTCIATLDIQDNAISDPEVLPEVLCKMQDLKVLYLKGNPVVKLIPHYRKTVIAAIPQLKYLDDRPVFDDDRRLAEAFVRGGLDAERDERTKMKNEKQEAHARNAAAFQKLIEDAKAVRREKEAMRAEDKYTDKTDPVETWRQKQDRFVRENPEYDYPERAQAAMREQTAKAAGDASPAPSAASTDEPPPLETVEKKPDWLEEVEEEKKPAYAPIDWDEDIFADAPASSKPSAKPPQPAAKPAAKRASVPITAPVEQTKPQPTFRPPSRATGPPAQKAAPVPAPGVRIVNELEELD
jgi:dynein assembly factor 1